MEPSLPSKVTVPAILNHKLIEPGEGRRRLTALTAYDFSMARILDQAGVDILLVGDSVSAVVQGLENTLPVTLDEMIYHCRAVSRGVKRALVVGDLPFMSYQVSVEQALTSAGRMVKEGNVGAVKLEGGVHMEETIRRITTIDIPVMGHVGLTPQSYHRMGGHRTQGKRTSGRLAGEAGTRDRVIEDARAVERAGAFAVVLEGIPDELANQITSELSIPTIGIGAGPGCDGQVLVSYDMLGFNPEFNPRFLKKYADLYGEIKSAAMQFISEVQTGTFPRRTETTDTKIAVIG